MEGISVFVIGDLHLYHGTDKPMDIFGAKWENHMEKLRDAWCETVSDGDTVIVPGDISWGMRAQDTIDDFLFLNALPGEKIILKGNHDYWWQTLKKLNAFLEENSIKNVRFLHNNAYVCGPIIACGTRGWFIEKNYTPEDEKIVNRESERLRLSLLEGERLRAAHPDKKIVCFLHYPPAYAGLKIEKICDILTQHEIERCYYGHLHTVKKERLVHQMGRTRLHLIAADYVNFTPQKIEL